MASTTTASAAKQGVISNVAERVAEQLKTFKNVEIVRGGTHITLPNGMDLETGAAWLMRRAEAENTDASVYEVINGQALDAMHAFMKVLAKKYGWVAAVPTPGFFGSTPPMMMGITVSATGETVQVPYGQIEVPNIKGKLNTTTIIDNGRVKFCLQGTVKQRHIPEVAAIAQETREYLKTNSIYKGMAIKVDFPTLDDLENEGPNPFAYAPEFTNVNDVVLGELVFNEDVEQMLDVNVWTTIKNLALVRAAGIPVKRGILLHGKFGVGKTLFALATAKISQDNNFTFIEVKDPKKVPEALMFAREMAPAVLFVEDIDRLDENGKRSDYFNEILNTIDGMTSKNEEIISIFTTNHIERITPAMMRPGRLDAVIELEPPTAESVRRLIRLYSRGMLNPHEDISEVGELLKGHIPAVVREVVERSKLAAIRRGDTKSITAEDLRVSGLTMRKHLDLLAEASKPKVSLSERERAMTILATAVTKGHEASERMVKSALEDTSRRLEEAILDKV